MKAVSAQRAWWWYVVYLLCLCVFALSFHLKVSAYDVPVPHANPSAAAKLWANGAKAELLPATTAITFWVAALLLLIQLADGRQATTASLETVSPAADRSPGYQPRRFARPPPSYLA